MIRIAQAAAVILALLSVQAQAQGLVAVKEDIKEILSGYHQVPGADYWKKFEPESAKALLFALSADPAEMAHIRSRAAMALVNFPGSQAEQHLLSVFTRQDRGYVRAAALKAYSSMTGEAAIPALEKALSDKDDLVKLSAIRSLGSVGGPQAGQILQKRMEDEQDPVANSAFKKALAKAGAAK